MALDPAIALQGQPAQIQNPLDVLTKIENVKALAEQRQALAQERQAQADKIREGVLDKARWNLAVQQAGGDPVAAADNLSKGGFDTTADYGRTLTAQTKQKAADALKAENVNAQAHLATGINIFASAADSPEHYAAAKQALTGYINSDPNLAKQFGPYLDQLVPDNPDPAQIPQIVQRLNGILLDAKDRATQSSQALDKFFSGKYDAGFAQQAANLPPDQRAQQLQTAAGLVLMDSGKAAADAFVQKWQALLQANPQEFLKAGLTPEQQAQSSDRAATAAETAKRDALAHQDRQAAIAQRAATATATSVDPNAPPTDDVIQYANDVKSGKLALTGVPAAKGKRDQVQTYLRKQGFDLEIPMTAQVRARYEFASSVLPQVEQVRELAQKIQAAGLMGSFSGRLRDAASAEAAAASMQGLTPEQQRLIGQFATQADLLASGTAMAHFGARGGSQADQMREQLTAGHKSIDTFLGNLDAAENVLKGYASDLHRTPSGSASGGVDVTDPNGKVHHFETQAQADAFKKLAGIK